MRKILSIIGISVGLFTLAAPTMAHEAPAASMVAAQPAAQMEAMPPAAPAPAAKSARKGGKKHKHQGRKMRHHKSGKASK